MSNPSLPVSPASGAGPLVRRLARQHKDLRALSQRLIALHPDQVCDPALLDDLVGPLHWHDNDEEAIVLPALLAASEVAVVLRRELEHDHLELETMLTELASLYEMSVGKSPPLELRALASHFAEALRGHLKHEERTLFPLLDSAFSLDDQLALVERLEKLDETRRKPRDTAATLAPTPALADDAEAEAAAAEPQQEGAASGDAPWDEPTDEVRLRPLPYGGKAPLAEPRRSSPLLRRLAREHRVLRRAVVGLRSLAQGAVVERELVTGLEGPLLWHREDQESVLLPRLPMADETEALAEQLRGEHQRLETLRVDLLRQLYADLGRPARADLSAPAMELARTLRDHLDREKKGLFVYVAMGMNDDEQAAVLAELNEADQRRADVPQRALERARVAGAA